MKRNPSAPKHPHRRRRRRAVLTCTLAAGTTFVGTASTHAAVEPPSPASGHAAVIAQGVVNFTDGPFHWQSTSIPATAVAAPVDTAAPTFVMSSGPAAVVVDGAAGPVARLAPGEGLFRPAGETTQLRTLSPSGAAALGIALVAGPGDAINTFTPGSSSRDVDLLRDVLNTNEALLVRADVSAFVMVTAGAVDADGVTVGAGSSTTLTGDLTLINRSPQTATVLVAIVGPTLGDVAEPPAPAPAPQTPATNPPSTNPPGTTAPDGPPATDEAPTESTPETTPETTPEPEPEPDPELDSDGDGLRDTDEAGFGSNPFDSDTDNDGLADGADRGSGCSPTSYDTDGDGFSDGSEVNAGTNCAVAGNG